MKYITTDKNHIMRPGLKFEFARHTFQDRITLNDYSFPFHKDNLDDWLEKGYIKEVEEKEFTKSDMMNFCAWALSAYDDEPTNESLNDWLTFKPFN